jgi:AcrR family transcriptional regulator
MVARNTVRAKPSGEDIGRSEEPSNSSRDKILDAAVRVAVQDGILAMTLDAVAREASVSKGGLLHHFRSKDDLITAMLISFRAKMQRAMDARMADDPNPRGRWLRATLQTIWSESRDGDANTPSPSDPSRFFTTMLTAFANNPHLLDPVRENMRQVRERLLAEGANGLRQLALGAAIHGLLLWQHLGVITADDPVHQTILDELLTLAEAPDPPIATE